MAKLLGGLLGKIIGKSAVAGAATAAAQNGESSVLSGVLHFFWGLFLFLLVVAAIAGVIYGVVKAVFYWSKEQEAHLLPALTNRFAQEQHTKINFWLHFYLIAIIFAYLLSWGSLFIPTDSPGVDVEAQTAALYEESVETEQVSDAEFSGLAVFLLLVFCGGIFAMLGAWLFAFYNITLRLWEVIPSDIARCTPAKAAGFSLVPFYNYYWWFIAFRGLAEDINKTAARYGSSVLISAEFSRNVCIVWVVIAVLPMLATDLGVFLQTMLELVFVGLTIVFFMQLRNAVTSLLILKTSPTTGNHPNP